MQPIVEMQWVSEHRDEIVLADVRWYLDGRSGKEEYEAGHAPGAVFVDLDRWLAAPPTSRDGRHPLPEPDVFSEGMSRCGISDESVVVAYDDAGGVIAARLVWMLRVTGHEAAILNGGITNFTGALESGRGVAPVVGTFAARAWPTSLLATIDDATDRGQIVIDARDRDRYEGLANRIDRRFGHIPGARNVPCRENIDRDGRLKPKAVVRATFEAAGVRPGASVVSYCGSGVTACHNLLLMEWAGLGRGRLFPGSWSQYEGVSLPAATGSLP